jgi:hypothetical protein
MDIHSRFIRLFMVTVLVSCWLSPTRADQAASRAAVLAMPGLVSFWDMSEAGGQNRVGDDANAYVLSEVNGPIDRVEDAGSPFGFAASFNGSQFLKAASADATPALNIYGPGTASAITVVGWVKWTDNLNFNGAFIAGRWNENANTRQYALFIDLPYYAGKNRVAGHVSATGGPSTNADYPELVPAGYDEPFSWDYSVSASEVPQSQWVLVAFTYDGSYVKSYLDGIFETYGPQNYNYKATYNGPTLEIR